MADPLEEAIGGGQSRHTHLAGHGQRRDVSHDRRVDEAVADADHQHRQKNRHHPQGLAEGQADKSRPVDRGQADHAEPGEAGTDQERRPGRPVQVDIGGAQLARDHHRTGIEHQHLADLGFGEALRRHQQWDGEDDHPGEHRLCRDADAEHGRHEGAIQHGGGDAADDRVRRPAARHRRHARQTEQRVADEQQHHDSGGDENAGLAERGDDQGADRHAGDHAALKAVDDHAGGACALVLRGIGQEQALHRDEDEPLAEARAESGRNRGPDRLLAHQEDVAARTGDQPHEQDGPGRETLGQLPCRHQHQGEGQIIGAENERQDIR